MEAHAELLISRRPMVWEVICDVADHYGFTGEAIVGPRRHRRLSYARHMAMYLAYQHCAKSFPQIAVAFNRKDHSTVIHGYRRIQEVEGSAEVVAAIAAILGAVYARQRRAPGAADANPAAMETST